jgi:hypothetical protein
MSRRLILTTFTLLGSALMNHRTHADAVLNSPDGRWQATIEDQGSAAGQCNGLRDIDQVAAYEPFLANTKHYVRIGTSLSWGTAVTAAMEDTFSKISFACSADTYTAVLRSSTHLGVIAVVHGEMVDGSAGGLRVSLSFHDTDPSAIVLGQYSVKPFVYANMNVDGQMTNNLGFWSVDHFVQSANNTGTDNHRWFIARNVAGRQSEYHSFMQDALENGVAELDNTTVGGPSDINTAISFATGGLGANAVHTVAYAIGNESISIPAAFGLAPNVGTVAINSVDNRWSASIRTGVGFLDYGAAGEINNVMDFDEPVGSSQFVNDASYYFAVNNTLSLGSSPLSDQFRRVTFHYPADHASLVTTVLNSKTWPGLVLVLDATMKPGVSGGLIVGMKVADTFNRGLNIQPFVYADLDCDNATTNFGGFNTDHFFQHAGVGSTQRWFKAASFDTFDSNWPSTVLSLLNSGVMTLPNTTVAGPSNIAAAFAFHPWPLADDQNYINGFALGNAGITIPSSFVFASPWFSCPADIAPAAGNGTVNVDDLLVLINTWGICPKGADCAGDIVPNFIGNGHVNVDDLLAVINAWGSCLPE